MQVRFVDLGGGVRTRCYVAGTAGPNLVLVHGGGAAADTWVRVIEALAQHARVYAPDLIGHGFADYVAPGPGETPQRFQLRHLLRFLDALELDRYVVAGSSFGGLIAALLYFERPKAMEKLILVGSSSVFHPPEKKGGSVSDAAANQLPALTNPSRESIRKRNVGSNFDKSDVFEEIVLAQLTAFGLPGRVEMFQYTTNGLRKSANQPAHQVYARLEQIAVPTLVISGRDDPRADWRVVEAEAKRLPKATVALFDRCGHKPFSEQAPLFIETVARFLKT